MTDYPGSVYSPRTKANKAGVVYDASKTTIGFAEDITKLDDEVVAIETELGTNPKGIYASVKANLMALWVAIANAVDDFLDLSDTPGSYSGQGGKAVLVNVGENALEFGEAGAAIGGLYGINVETLTGAKTLTPDTDEIYQYLDTNGSHRNITLATVGAEAGDRFVVRHNGTWTTGVRLVIKQAAITLDYIYAGGIKEFIFNGTNWISGSIGSGENDNKKKNIHIGWQAIGINQGVAVGYSTYASDRGTAIGYDAYGYSTGVAIGYLASATGSVAIGPWARGYFGGIAIGSSADCNSKRRTICLGAKSKAYRVGELTININEDSSQKYNIVIGKWSGSSPDNTPKEIYAAGYSTSKFTIRPQSVLAFTILITARNNISGDCAAWKVEGAIKRNAANYTGMLVAATITAIHKDDATWDVAVTADNTNNSLKIEVTGAADSIIQWAARMDGVETHF